MRTGVAINGLGRIGRAILKLVIDEPSLELIAVNDTQHHLLCELHDELHYADR